MTASSFIHTVILSKRDMVDDGMGNEYGQWVEQFRTRAAYLHLKGSETVMAGRLQGRHTQVISVRASSLTIAISTDWKLTDATTGIAFNIRDKTVNEDRATIDLLCESGVAI